MLTMRFIYSNSKSIISAVLSCILLIASYNGNLNVADVGSIDTENSSAVATSSDTATESNATQTVSSIWDSLSPELKLDHKVHSAQVQAEIHKLLADQDKLYSILKAAGPYIYFIHKQTQARGLPAELALIPVIESEFNPHDHSNKGASGLWQLMPATAHGLGVKVKSNYDGRRNVVASTKAALAYFKDLGHLFEGNWYLAIAAYNCGEMRIKSAERRTGSSSFWNLPLPRETKYYVPKLLAVAAIVKDPAKYGIELPPINNQPYFTEIKMKQRVNLKQVAKTTGISVETLHTLNPDYNHETVPHKDATLLVPVSKAPTVKEKLADKIVTVT